LADGHLKAADVEAVWACFDRNAFADARERAASAIELAFGPFADGIHVDLRPALRSPYVSTALAEARCACAVARGQARLGVAVSIGILGRNSAVAFRRAR
jgi:hypothetical protein